MNQQEKARRAKKRRLAKAALRRSAAPATAKPASYSRADVVKLIASMGQLRKFLGLALAACGGRIVVPPSILADTKALNHLFVSAREVSGKCLEIALLTAELLGVELDVVEVVVGDEPCEPGAVASSMEG